MNNKFKVTSVISLFTILVIIACASCNASPRLVPTRIGVIDTTKEAMTMQVVIQVSPDIARALHQRSPPIGESETLLRTIETFGLKLEPMHPDTNDPDLQSYFRVEVKDQATAQR